MIKLTQTTIYKISPLIILYSFFMITFLNKSDYEAIIALTASIPLIVYIFNKNPKVEKILRYVLYLFIIGLIIHLINLFTVSCSWFSFCLRNYDNATVWSVLKWNWFFIYNFKYLIYIGIIFLALKNKKEIRAKF